MHYNSSKPDEVGALAYTQGTNICVAPGQERHLSHEAWHVVQQAQGRVKPTAEVGGLPLNDSRTLEPEADAMGDKIILSQNDQNCTPYTSNKTNNQIIQRMVKFEKNADPRKAIIIQCWFKRPEGTSSSGAHTTAISLFQEAAINAVINCTYDTALDHLKRLIFLIRELPGYKTDLEPGIQELVQFIDICRIDDPLNWGADLDEIAEKYILLRERVDYTHHEADEGGSSGKGEGPALTRLHKNIEKLKAGEKLVEGENIYKKIAEDIMRLLDLRNVQRNPEEPHLIWQTKVFRYLRQHLDTAYAAYSILRQYPVIYGWVVSLAAEELGVSPKVIYDYLS